MLDNILIPTFSKYLTVEVFTIFGFDWNTKEHHEYIIYTKRMGGYMNGL